MLGASPDTDEAGVRLVLSKYGEVIEASKGLISPKKLPGCSNGIWTVKLILEKDQTLPPFLIMKEEGEVWQLATGEISVCWKCGSIGHIGDRCYQDVSALAASLVGPSISLQPSWAHVVRGGSAVPQLPQLPLPPPLPLLPPPSSYKLCVPITPRVILLARSKLKIVGCENRFGVDDAGVHPEFRDEFVREQLDKKAKAVNLPVDKSAQLVEDVVDASDVAAVDFFVAGEIISQLDESQVLVQPADSVYDDVGKDDNEKNEEYQVMISETASCQQHKKARLSSELVKSSDPENMSTSPILHHKVPSGSKQHQELPDDQDECGGVHTNMFGINYVMWFDLSIEGKSPMDPEEEDWGGKIEFGFSDKNFPKDLEDYFLMFEDECTTQSHSCAGRVMGVLFDKRSSVLNPPSYDPRNVVDLLDKYRDGHIVDSGWREVDTEEWVTT